MERLPDGTIAASPSDNICELASSLQTGETLALSPGVYKIARYIVVDKDVTIKSLTNDARDVTIVRPGSTALYVKGGAPSIENLTFFSPEAEDIEMNADDEIGYQSCVAIRGGSPTLIGCRAASADQSGFSVRGKKTTVRMTRCETRLSHDCGVFFDEGATGVVEDCVFADCRLSGVDVEKTPRGKWVELVRTKLCRGDNMSLSLHNGGRVRARDCEAFAQISIGVVVEATDCVLEAYSSRFYSASPIPENIGWEDFVNDSMVGDPNAPDCAIGVRALKSKLLFEDCVFESLVAAFVNLQRPTTLKMTRCKVVDCLDSILLDPQDHKPICVDCDFCKEPVVNPVYRYGSGYNAPVEFELEDEENDEDGEIDGKGPIVVETRELDGEGSVVVEKGELDGGFTFKRIAGAENIEFADEERDKLLRALQAASLLIERSEKQTPPDKRKKSENDGEEEKPRKKTITEHKAEHDRRVDKLELILSGGDAALKNGGRYKSAKKRGEELARVGELVKEILGEEAPVSIENGEDSLRGFIYPNSSLGGTFVVSKELSSLKNWTPSNPQFRRYELAIATREADPKECGLDGSSSAVKSRKIEAADAETPFLKKLADMTLTIAELAKRLAFLDASGKTVKRFGGVQFPDDYKVGAMAGRCFIFDALSSKKSCDTDDYGVSKYFDYDLDINPRRWNVGEQKDFGLMLAIEVTEKEYEKALQTGVFNFIPSFQEMKFWPFSDLDREECLGH